jgi:hypothetical protein
MIHHDAPVGRDAMSASKEKFATQVTPDILAEVRALAHSEGRQLQALVDEALTDLIEKRRNTRPRPHVMNAYNVSHEKYAELYQKLAK